MRVRYIPRAQHDIDDIFADTADAYLDHAQRVETAIRLAAELLRREPNIGVATGHDNVRRWPMTDYGYAIFYRIDWDQEFIDVLRVIANRRVRNVNRIPR